MIVKIIEWVATIVTLLGAVMTSMEIYPWNVHVLGTGSLLWIIWSILEKKLSIGIVNTGMLLIYLYGILSRMNLIPSSLYE